ncbi:GNAT family N-acetyltransferase [Flexivirga meconopsidis]|uniref:GNAT family N-acetyltransferase n=1 Tax=Flexivirga meconopsidis TaxID=2977121 RepID=UPI0022405CBD|nr:GNAT family N-acetyltransferase [Flexivirga meconopsidis]
MLRPATDADKELVRVWRNHPDVRAVSLNRELISPAEHDAYWQSLQGNRARKVFIYERGGAPAGVVTFFDIDDDAKTAMWGYYLDNEGLGARGELLPAWITIQREAVKFAFARPDAGLGLDELYGEVLDVNEAVRRMNTRNGFEEIDTQEREIAGEPTVVHTIRRRRQPND